MSYRFIKLAKIINELGLPNTLDAFENRLLIQKAIYLLQSIGMELNYDFSWYLYGPYSPELASEVYAIYPILNSLINEYKFTENDQKFIRKMKQVKNGLNQESKKLGLNIVDAFELAASIVFIVRHNANDDMNFVISNLTSLKPKFKEKEIEGIYNLLKKIGVF